MPGPPWKILKVVSKGDYNYAVVPDHPCATKNGYVLEHRIVMENAIGRLLRPNELVHHHNENKKDNNRSNLRIKTKGQHEREHGLAKGQAWVRMRCPGCLTIFERVRRLSHLSKGGLYSCCSLSCCGKVWRLRQANDPRIEDRIMDNVIKEYRRYS